MAHDQAVVAVEAADGHRFELIHVPAAASTQHRLLCLPGMGLTARQYIPFAQALAQQGIETFIHEWRGLGASSWRAGRSCDWGYQALLEQDLAAALATLPNQPLIFAGHSLGSQLAAVLAGQHPERCSGIVVIAGGSPWLGSFSGRMRWGLSALFRLMPLLVHPIGHFPGKQLGFAGREARSVMIDWARSGLTGEYQIRGVDADLEAAMRAVQQPVLSVRMVDDWFVTPASAQWLTDKLGGDRKREMVLDATALGLSPDQKADHYVWMRQPERIAADLKGWADIDVLRLIAT
jgi:predicted alpha/beta hydrolase